MDTYSSSEIVADGLCVGLDVILKFVERFKGGFAMDWSEVCYLEEGVLVIGRARHSG